MFFYVNVSLLLSLQAIVPNNGLCSSVTAINQLQDINNQFRTFEQFTLYKHTPCIIVQNTNCAVYLHLFTIKPSEDILKVFENMSDRHCEARAVRAQEWRA